MNMAGRRVFTPLRTDANDTENDDPFALSGVAPPPAVSPVATTVAVSARLGPGRANVVPNRPPAPICMATDGPVPAPSASLAATTVATTAPTRQAPAAVSQPTVCPVCDAWFREQPAFWRHLNQEHIARRIFPPAAFLEQHGSLCGHPTCSYAYSARWQTCPRSLGTGQGRCGGTLLDPSIVIAARNIPQSVRAPRPPDQPQREAPPTPARDDPDHLPGYAVDPVLSAVAAAACLRA